MMWETFFYPKTFYSFRLILPLCQLWLHSGRWNIYIYRITVVQETNKDNGWQRARWRQPSIHRHYIAGYRIIWYISDCCYHLGLQRFSLHWKLEDWSDDNYTFSTSSRDSHWRTHNKLCRHVFKQDKLSASENWRMQHLKNRRCAFNEKNANTGNNRNLLFKRASTFFHQINLLGNFSNLLY